MPARPGVWLQRIRTMAVPPYARRLLTTACAGVALTALVVHRRIDDVLSAMHEAGAPAHGIGDLVPLLALPDGRTAERVLTVWRDAPTAQPDLAMPADLRRTPERPRRWGGRCRSRR